VSGVVASEIEKSVSLVKVRAEYNPSDLISTVSMGVVSIVPNVDINSNVIIELADKALYMAKSKGKDQICAL